MVLRFETSPYVSIVTYMRLQEGVGRGGVNRKHLDVINGRCDSFSRTLRVI
jgi:hypothetical protein